MMGEKIVMGEASLNLGTKNTVVHKYVPKKMGYKKYS